MTTKSQESRSSLIVNPGNAQLHPVTRIELHVRPRLLPPGGLLRCRLVFVLCHDVLHRRMNLGQPGRVHVARPQTQALPFPVFARRRHGGFFPIGERRQRQAQFPQRVDHLFFPDRQRRDISLPRLQLAQLARLDPRALREAQAGAASGTLARTGIRRAHVVRFVLAQQGDGIFAGGRTLHAQDDLGRDGVVQFVGKGGTDGIELRARLKAETQRHPGRTAARRVRAEPRMKEGAPVVEQLRVHFQVSGAGELTFAGLDAEGLDDRDRHIPGKGGQRQVQVEGLAATAVAMSISGW